MNKKKPPKCDICGQPITFIKTANGRFMPVDLELVPFWIDHKALGRIITKSGVTISCNFKGIGSEMSGVGHIPHFATCKEFSRKKRLKETANTIGEREYEEYGL